MHARWYPDHGTQDLVPWYHCDLRDSCVCVPSSTATGASSSRLRLAAHHWCAQEQIGFDSLLLCTDADLAELGLRKGVRVKILGTMRGWAARELARLS